MFYMLGQKLEVAVKSINKGINWVSVGDDFFYGGSITVIKVDPTNENIIYVGMLNSLYKSTNGGPRLVDHIKR